MSSVLCKMIKTACPYTKSITLRTKFNISSMKILNKAGDNRLPCLLPLLTGNGLLVSTIQSSCIQHGHDKNKCSQYVIDIANLLLLDPCTHEIIQYHTIFSETFTSVPCVPCRCSTWQLSVQISNILTGSSELYLSNTDCRTAKHPFWQHTPPFGLPFQYYSTASAPPSRGWAERCQFYLFNIPFVHIVHQRQDTLHESLRILNILNFLCSVYVVHIWQRAHAWLWEPGFGE